MDFLQEFDYRDVHLQIREDQYNFLKTIDPDNQSKAMRKIIDDRMKQKKRETLGEILLIIVFFLTILIAGILVIQFI